MAAWADTTDARMIWSDAPANDALLNHLLDVSQELCEEYAPVLVDPNPWAASTAYTLGDRVMLAGGAVLKCTNAGGTSGAVEPTAPGEVGGVVVDGSVTWREIALVPARYKQAVVQQARETWQNAERDGDVLGFDGEYAIRRRLADSVKQLLRPRRGVDTWMVPSDEEATP